MYVQGVKTVSSLILTAGGGCGRCALWRCVSPRRMNIRTIILKRRNGYSVWHFDDAENECQQLVARGLALPAYDQCMKASHNFNLLDARGVISVTERQAYIGRVRALARACAEAWLADTVHGEKQDD